MTEALFYEKTEDGCCLCRLCPHLCNIKEGHTGYCRVRRNTNGVLYSESYGLISSIALDPIEKKPLQFFHSGSKILSIGGYGCNLSCSFCQNHEISMTKPPTEDMPPDKLAEIASGLIKDGNIGLAYTYNEPFIAFEYVLDCARLCRAKGLKNVLVTNGYASKEPLNMLLPYIDAMNIDLKSFSSVFYNKIGGNLEKVKETIVTAVRFCHVEITTLIIPDENDSEKEIENLSQWLSQVDDSIPLHLTCFRPRYKMTDKPSTTEAKIAPLRRIASKYLRNIV